MKIVLAIDGSEHSEEVIQDSKLYRWPEKSEFKVVTVVDNSMPVSGDGTKAAQALADKAAESLRSEVAGLAGAEGQVLRGNAKQEIMKVCDNWKADLLLTGSRGRRGISRVVLGSVSHSLLMAVGCSVRIVRGVKLDRPYVQRVLVALDDSQYSKQVVSVLTARPWSDGAQLRLVTSVPTLAQFMQEHQTQSQDVGPLKIARDDHLEAALTSLESTSADVRDKVKNVEVDFKVIDGDPREAICDEADRWGARLIVTGCKGKGWIERLLVGSVSEAIATWANCSVEVVKN